MSPLKLAVLVVVLLLLTPATASAHHVDQAKSTADCYGASIALVGFSSSDGDVQWTARIDGTIVASGSVPRFSGDHTVSVTWPTLAAGDHAFRFDATWPTKGSNNGTVTKQITGCPGPPPPPPAPIPPTAAPPVPTPPKVTPPKLPKVDIGCPYMESSRWQIKRRGDRFRLVGERLFKFRWKVDGVRIGRKRTVRLPSWRHQRKLTVTANVNECQRIKRVQRLPNRVEPGGAGGLG